MTQYKLTPAEIVGKKLKNLIKQSEFRTQENFAEAMNVDPTTVRKWLYKGINNLNLIYEIADVLDVDFKELLIWEVLFLLLENKWRYFIFKIYSKMKV